MYMYILYKSIYVHIYEQHMLIKLRLSLVHHLCIHT